MKNYPYQLVKSIQDNINDGNCVIRNFKTSSELPHFVKINGVLIILSEEDSKRSSTYVYDYTFNKKDFNEWKKESVGRFYTRDWTRSLAEDKAHLYKEIRTSVVSDMTLLVRELETDTLTTEDKEYLTDLMIDGKPYSIIKAFLTEDEKYEKKSNLENINFTERLIFNYKYVGEEDEEKSEKEEDEDLCEGIDLSAEIEDVPSDEMNSYALF